MRVDVIINPGAGSANVGPTWQRHLSQGHELRLRATVDPGSARTLARAAADDGADLVIAAGGDGTVTQVVDGLMSARRRVPLGVLPLGTGNDLARTLGIPLVPDEALEVLLENRLTQLDVMAVEVDGDLVTYGVNVAAGGFSGEVDEVMSPESKARWGPLAYVWSALKVAPDPPRYATRLVWDGTETETVDALNIVVANARTVAGGRVVAPRANPEDGMLDVVIVRFGSKLDLAGVAARLLGGDYMGSDLVSWRQARSVQISSEPAMPFNVDGELLDRATLRFRILPKALDVVVGPTYRPDALDTAP
jgi:diacylglycerol kinase (ATP)